MRMRFAGLALAVAGCITASPDGGPPDADYRAATSAQLKEAIYVASGNKIFGVLLQLPELTREGRSCPSLTRFGAWTTLHGGCDEDDVRWDGTLRIRNYQDWRDGAGVSELELVADHFGYASIYGDPDGVAMWWDGVLTLQDGMTTADFHERDRDPFSGYDLDVRVVGARPPPARAARCERALGTARSPRRLLPDHDRRRRGRAGLLVVTRPGTVAAMSAAPTLADWDLTPYFADLAAPDFAAFRAALERDAPALRTRAEALAPIADDVDGWAALLVELEDLGARLRHIGSYLGCRTSADAADQAASSALSGLDPVRTEVDKALVAVRAAFAAAPEAAFARLLDDPRLAGARYYLDRIRQRAAWSMAPALEGLAAELAPTALRAWGRLYDQLSGTLRFTLAVPGQAAVEHPVAMTRTLLEDADPAVRKAALAGANAAWKGAADVTAACLNAISGTRLTLYKRRGVGHFLEPALFDAGIERATLDAMLGAVRDRQDLPRRYLRGKAQRLGLPRLGFQDLMAPLPRPDAARIPWDEGCRRVRDAFGAAYPGLRDLAERAFARRWIDHSPRGGKRPGGYCTSSPLLGESRIFMTYHGALGDVQTLAHELGHAFHNWVMRDLRLWARSYPMTLAETASTFAEELVLEATLAAPATSAADRLAILDARLQDASAFLLNIPMRFDFEHAVYQERAAGELSVDRLSALMLEAQRRNYGDALADDQLDPMFWASKLHFYITDVSFYNFPYTFGYLFSRGIVARFRAEGPSFLPRYEALLRATGSAGAEDVARDTLGVDLRGRAFWDGAIELIAEDLARFEAA